MAHDLIYVVLCSKELGRNDTEYVTDNLRAIKKNLLKDSGKYGVEHDWYNIEVWSLSDGYIKCLKSSELDFSSI